MFVWILCLLLPSRMTWNKWFNISEPRFLCFKMEMVIIHQNRMRAPWDFRCEVLSTMYHTQCQGASQNLCSYPSPSAYTSKSSATCYNKQIWKFQWIQNNKALFLTCQAVCVDVPGLQEAFPLGESGTQVTSTCGFFLSRIRKKRVEKACLGPGGRHIASAYWWEVVTWLPQKARGAGKWDHWYGSHVSVTMLCYRRRTGISGEHWAISAPDGATLRQDWARDQEVGFIVVKATFQIHISFSLF